MNKNHHHIFKSINVSKIMVPSKYLQRANDSDKAMFYFKEFGYSIIPYPEKDKITGYFNNVRYNGVESIYKFLISSDTPVISLPRLFLDNPFYFVINSNEIVGYIHLSDLNNTLVKLPFYTLFETIESKIFESVKNVSEEVIKNAFPKEEFKKIINKKKRLSNKDLQNGWIGCFYFSDMLTLSIFLCNITISKEEKKILIDYRNRIAHADKLLVNDHSEIIQLINVRKIIDRILKQLN